MNGYYWESMFERGTNDPIIVLYKVDPGGPPQWKLSVRLGDMGAWGEYARHVGRPTTGRISRKLPEEIKTEAEAKAYVETIIRMGVI